MIKPSETRWICDRCNRELQGNPRWCPHCGYTIYRPIYPSREEVQAYHAARKEAHEDHGSEPA